MDFVITKWNKAKLGPEASPRGEPGKNRRFDRAIVLFEAGKCPRSMVDLVGQNTTSCVWGIASVMKIRKSLISLTSLFPVISITGNSEGAGTLWPIPRLARSPDRRGGGWRGHALDPLALALFHTVIFAQNKNGQTPPPSSQKGIPPKIFAKFL